MKTLIVIPTYNEAGNIDELLAAIDAACGDAIDLLFVDDNSPDGTADRIADRAEASPRSLYLLRRPRKLGLGTAYVKGMSWGLERGYEILVEMDADLSHDPIYLPEMLQRIETYDVVVGSRYVAGGGTRNWGPIRRLVSRGGSLYARTILDLPLRDLTGGYNVWRREILERIGLDSVLSQGYMFQIEMKYRAWNAGASIEEMPIVFVDRAIGSSKMSAGLAIEAVSRVWQLRRIGTGRTSREGAGYSADTSM